MIPASDARDEARAILDSIRRLVRALRLFSGKAEQDLGLSAAQLFVLQQLSAAKPVSMKELAKRSYTDQSSVSAVVARLVEKGLASKKASAQDQRNLELRLTPKGLGLLKGQPDALQSKIAAVLMKMGTLERKGLKQGLEKLVEGTGINDEKPEMLFSHEGN